jgi:hypothetical protein
MTALLLILAASAPLACPHLARHTLREAAEHHVRPALLDAVAKLETGCDPHKVGRLGEVGPWGILPTGSAARGLGRRGLARPAKNAHAAARHLRKLLDLCDGSEIAALNIFSANRRRCTDIPSHYAAKVMAVAAGGRSGWAR